MVDPATLSITVERTVSIEAPKLDLLLYDWLSEMIYLKDRDRQVFPAARVTISGTGPFKLDAIVQGGVIEPARTSLGADPKAVTFHQFLLEQIADGWRARLVIDI
jgi:SHS2 domain-containing protein